MSTASGLSFRQGLFYMFPALFGFFLPFGSLLLSALIIGWTVASFFILRKEFFLNGLRSFHLRAMHVFFLITLLSAAFSENHAEALFNIENKLSFVFIPYLVFCFPWPEGAIRRVIVSFVSGCFFACIWLIGRAAFYYLQGEPGYFFYTLFSDFIHPSHFALYLIFASSVIVIRYPRWFAGQRSLLMMSALFLCVFILSIFLCSSKTGLIAFALVTILFLVSQLKQKLNDKNRWFAAALLLALFAGCFLFLDGPFERLRALTSFSAETFDPASTESTGVRFMIWKQGFGIAQRHWLTGVGAGDANDALREAYKNAGMTGAFEHQLNAHNQYFQTLIGLGVAGLAALLAITWYPLLKAALRKNLLLSIFLLLISLNFFVESMLQRSDGTLFYVFFFCFLHQYSPDNEIS
jgi:O-antigen ligase